MVLLDRRAFREDQDSDDVEEDGEDQLILGQERPKIAALILVVIAVLAIRTVVVAAAAVLILCLFSLLGFRRGGGKKDC
jgi:hypothetical protein